MREFAFQRSILYRFGKTQQETWIMGCRELISKPLLGKLQSGRKRDRGRKILNVKRKRERTAWSSGGEVTERSLLAALLERLLVWK